MKMGQRKNESKKFQIKLGMGPAFKAQLAEPTHMLDKIQSFPSSPAVSRKRITYGWKTTPARWSDQPNKSHFGHLVEFYTHIKSCCFQIFYYKSKCLQFKIK